MSNGGQLPGGIQTLMQQAGMMPGAQSSAPSTIPMNQPAMQSPGSFLGGAPSSNAFMLPYQLPQQSQPQMQQMQQGAPSPYSAAFQGGGLTPRIGPQSAVPIWQPSAQPPAQQSFANPVPSLGQISQQLAVQAAAKAAAQPAAPSAPADNSGVTQNPVGSGT